MIRPWMLWTLAAVIQWAIWSLLSRGVEDTLNATQSQAISTLGILPVLAVLISSLQRKTSNGSNKPTSAISRAVWGSTAAALGAGLLTCAGNMAYYHALSFGTQITSTISLTALYPMVTVLLAMVCLHERLGVIQWIGMALSLVAIALLNLAPDTAWWTPALSYTLIPILSWGIAGLLQKLATRHLSGKAATFWFLAAFVPVGIGLSSGTIWPGSVPAQVWLLGVLLGLFFGGGNLALLMAYEKNGKASIIAPIASLYPMLSIPAAVILFAEKVGARQWAGIALAMVAALALSLEPTPEPAHRQT